MTLRYMSGGDVVCVGCITGVFSLLLERGTEWEWWAAGSEKGGCRPRGIAQVKLKTNDAFLRDGTDRGERQRWRWCSVYRRMGEPGGRAYWRACAAHQEHGLPGYVIADMPVALVESECGVRDL